MTTPGDAFYRQRVTVLLVDDQRIIGESIRITLLADPDIEFHFESDPFAALETAARVSPTVILQDLVMPGLSGLDLVSSYRADERTRHVPLVVLSTKEDPSIKAEAFSRGANDYLVKLPSATELLARIRYHSKAYVDAQQSRLAYEALLESRERLARKTEELEIRNRFIRKTFGRYLSDDVVASLLESPEGLALGGESRSVTILMSDLRGFTSSAERLSPQDVVRVLNGYLGRMADVITDHRGTIDELIGDAILALFGAPLLSEDDAERAVACAIEMQRAMAGVNAENVANGLPVLEMGIALHTGEVVVGNIGSQTRAKYGIVGSNVNLTARIESMSVGGQVLVSEATRLAAKERVFVGQQLSVKAKGFKTPLTAWDVKGIERDGVALYMPEAEKDELVPLQNAVGVRFALVTNKQVEDLGREGRFVSLARRSALLVPLEGESPPALSDLRIRLLLDDGSELSADLYAKAVGEGASIEGVPIRFTAVPPEAQGFLEKVRAREGGGSWFTLTGGFSRLSSR